MWRVASGSGDAAWRVASGSGEIFPRRLVSELGTVANGRADSVRAVDTCMTRAVVGLGTAEAIRKVASDSGTI